MMCDLCSLKNRVEELENQGDESLSVSDVRDIIAEEVDLDDYVRERDLDDRVKDAVMELLPRLRFVLEAK
jgi:hypothetical protein